ncbi:MAG: hypothetical protein C0595_04560 [Marinilabiliales bacterium]|nr:MAG: hypothetical protein C0595_04560 [Marinilabiliales bacterium]
MAKNNSKKTQISKEQWLILLSLMLGVFLGALDISIVSPAFSNIANELHIEASNLSWIITLYTLVYVLAVPLMSSISDKYGRKNTILLNITLFGLGSLFAVFSQDISHLLIARGIQALGAGGLFPIASTVIGEIFPKERRGMALGFIGMVWGVAAIIGPLIGGWLTQWFGWTSIFYVSFFLSFVVIFFIWKFLPKSKAVHNHPFDWIGMLILGIALLTLTYALNNLDGDNLISGILNSNEKYYFMISILAFIVFFEYEKRPKAPIIATHIFYKRELNIALMLSFARGMTEAGLAFLPFYAMVALNIKAGPAGTLIITTAITMFLFTQPAGMLVDKIGPKMVLIFGAIVTTIGAALMMSANTMMEFIVYQVILGLGLSAMSGAPIRYIVLHETDEKEKSSAQGLVSLVSSFGIMVGSALAGSFLALGNAGETPSLSGFHNIYLSVVLSSILALIFTFALKKSKVLKNEI